MLSVNLLCLWLIPVFKSTWPACCENANARNRTRQGNKKYSDDVFLLRTAKWMVLMTPLFSFLIPGLMLVSKSGYLFLLHNFRQCQLPRYCCIFHQPFQLSVFPGSSIVECYKAFSWQGKIFFINTEIYLTWKLIEDFSCI